jgi:uridine monophosphate synthetase
MVMRRKEKKEYGTARLLEGVYHKGERCLIIEDVITSGTSILETAETLRSEGLIVEDAVVLVDREQGGAKALRQHNLRVHSILTISTIMETLIQKGKIEKTIADEVQTFVQSHQLC